MKEYLKAKRTAVLIGLVVMAITAIPYLLGYAAQGEEWRFSGFLIGVEDGNSYIAKMLSGSAGSWLFRSPYSAEDQNGALIFFPYLLLGKLAAGTARHEQLVALFHLYRILAGLLVALAGDDFLALYIKNTNRRYLALSLTLMGGGLGWIVAIAGMKNFLGSLPLDFLSPESFGFLGIFGLPHLAISRALLFWGITSYLKRDSGFRAGMLWLVMGFFQPMNILIAWIVCAVQALLEILAARISPQDDRMEWEFRTSSLAKALQAGLISSPLVIYNIAVFYFDPYLSAWTAQNKLPSPHWGHYLIAYGPVLPLAILGIREGIRNDPQKGLLLTAWLSVFPFLVYAPVNPQRRLAEGIWVILITGMFIFFEKKEHIPIFGKVVLACLVPTSIFILWGASGRALNPGQPSFSSNAEVTAYHELEQLAPTNSIVLSSFEVGNSLPAWAPVRVVIGHGPETVNLERWEAEIESYFSANQGRTDCGDFFSRRGIEYLFWGPVEEASWEWDPEIKDCLYRVYNSQDYRIYQVDQD